MNPIFLQLGPIKIYYYGLMYALSFFIGSELAKRKGKEQGIPVGITENYAFIAMFSGLLGGRLYYVAFNLPYYLSEPSQILAVWNGGMAIHGGIIGGIIGTIIYSKIKKINAFQMGDLVAPSLILGQALGRIGNLMNGEIHGVPTFTPWNIIFTIKPKFVQWYSYYNSLPIADKMNFKELVPFGLIFPGSSTAGQEFPNLPLHPAMMYESVLNFIGFLFIWFILSKKKYAKGTTWWSYIIIYSFIRIFTSFFRAEDLMMYGIRAPHFISLVLIGISTGIIIYINRKNKSEE
ncbi:MAG: prolipoprotein diacylglyceryl transferase [Fusobacteriaceae bacterium]